MNNQVETANDTITRLTALIVKVYGLAENAEDAEDTLAEIFDSIEDNREVIPGLNVAIVEHRRENMRDVYAVNEVSETDDDLSTSPFDGNLFGGA